MVVKKPSLRAENYQCFQDLVYKTPQESAKRLSNAPQSSRHPDPSCALKLVSNDNNVRNIKYKRKYPSD
ncbi:hypothetical protein Mapa_004722 [Marchantia paleacea]|nr:hypothetical protein Mapa_004722 [Marchantia paleacea]